MTDNPLKTTYPIFEVELPTSGQKISCRPYLVKEERILLAAKEAGREEDVSLAILQIVRNVVLDKTVDVEKLNSVDIQHIFLRARSEAVGNIVKVPFICNNVVDEKECGGEFEFALDLKMAKPSVPIKKTFEEVPLTDTYLVMFRYPLFEKLRAIKDDDPEDVKTTKKVQSVIDYVAKEDGDPIIFDMLSVEHINEFIESLTTKQFEVINEFIESLPEMVLDTEAKCGKCGYVHTGHFENLSSFF